MKPEPIDLKGFIALVGRLHPDDIGPLLELGEKLVAEQKRRDETAKAA